MDVRGWRCIYGTMLLEALTTGPLGRNGASLIPYSRSSLWTRRVAS